VNLIITLSQTLILILKGYGKMRNCGIQMRNGNRVKVRDLQLGSGVRVRVLARAWVRVGFRVVVRDACSLHTLVCRK